MIAVLDRKLLRDLVRLRGQLIAIALVIACGIALFVGMRSVMASLESARADYINPDFDRLVGELGFRRAFSLEHELREGVGLAGYDKPLF